MFKFNKARTGFLGALYIIGAMLLFLFVIALDIVAGACIPVTVVFLILQLCSVITWNWFFIFLPLICGVVAMVLLVVIHILIQIFE